MVMADRLPVSEEYFDMKVLICSVTAGEGHNSTARAVRDKFGEMGIACDILDTYKYASPAIAKLISEGYLFVSDKAQLMFGAGYRIAEKRHSGGVSVARLFNSQFTDEIGEYIRDYSPDAVLFTHPFSGLILDVLKQKKLISVKTVGILTDFTFHPYWEECRHCDYVVVPSPMLLYQARKKGFPDSAVLPLGIPINGKFAKSMSKGEAKCSLGLNPEVKAVLLMGGSMGHGNLASVVKKLDALEAPERFQIISVCGNNEDEYEKIEKYKGKARLSVLNLGFVNYVDRLMDAADIIVTKPGGLTTSESLAKRLPMIIVNPIPGQEARNTAFLLNNGTAMAASKTSPVDELVFSLLGEEGKDRYNEMLRCIDILRRPNSAADVCGFVAEMCASGI